MEQERYRRRIASRVHDQHSRDARIADILRKSHVGIAIVASQYLFLLVLVRRLLLTLSSRCRGNRRIVLTF
jgi:hypothetical protein